MDKTIVTAAVATVLRHWCTLNTPKGLGKLLNCDVTNILSHFHYLV